MVTMEDRIARCTRLVVDGLHEKQIQDFPCLSQVASALFGMKPGSGGLECDIGSMGDVIGRRRGSLGPGIVEASMMIKLNKDRIVRDVMMVKEYPTSWKAFIPKRPDDPADYYINNELDDQTHADDSNETDQEQMGLNDSDDDDDDFGLGS
jgi:hypothetical protein